MCAVETREGGAGACVRVRVRRRRLSASSETGNERLRALVVSRRRPGLHYYTVVITVITLHALTPQTVLGVSESALEPVHPFKRSSPVKMGSADI